MERQNETIRKMARNTLLLMLVSLVGVVLSFLKEALIAKYFGTSYVADAYVVAVDLPITLFSFISMAVSVVIIPNYTQIYTRESREEANKYYSNLTSLTILICFVFCGLLMVLAEHIIFIVAPGLEKLSYDLAIKMFRIVLPSSVFLILVKVNTGILNVYKSFTLPALGNWLMSLSFVAIIMIAVDYLGIYAACIGTLIGSVVEWIYTSKLRRKYEKFFPRIDIKNVYVKKSIQMAVPVFIGTAAEELNKVIDQFVASGLTEGSISSLNYGAKISSGISNLLLSGIATVFYPEMSRRVAQDDNGGVAEIYHLSIDLLILLVVPLLFGGGILKDDIVELIYGRGAFDEKSVKRTAPIFLGYLFAMFFSAIRQSCTNLFNSYKETRKPVINSVIGIAINIVLNFLLAKPLGAIGLVVATIVSSIVTALMLMRSVKRKNSNVCYKGNCILLGKTLISCIVMTIVMFIVYRLFEAIGMRERLKIIYVVIMVLIGMLSYLCGLFFMRTKELKRLVEMLKRERK